MAEFSKQVALGMGIKFDEMCAYFRYCTLYLSGSRLLLVDIDNSLETVALGIPGKFATTEQILKGLRAWEAN